MGSYINSAIFGWYPYLCAIVFLVGSLLRFDTTQYSWRSGSSQLLRRRQLRLGSNLFHIGILVLLVGHTGGLLTPVAVLDALGIPHESKQILAMTVGGVAGAMCFAGLLMLAHRRLADPRIRANSSFADTAIVLLLLVQVTLGLLTIPLSGADTTAGDMVNFMNWAQGIVFLNPHAASYVADVPLLFKVHLTLGMTLFLLFPFTRLVHIWSVPIWYLGRPGYQIVRARWRQGAAGD